ncbi:MAG: glycosyltransferase family 2 protein [Thermomicrobiales bacterium]
MATLLADIFVTIKPTEERRELTLRSLSSLVENTDRSQYRLTVCLDGAAPDWSKLYQHADYVIGSHENEGLGPTINRALQHIFSINDWYAGAGFACNPDAVDMSKVAPYIVMCQDDLIYSKDWLPILASRFRAYGRLRKLGFASGVECIEHPVRETLADGIVLKDWIRAAQMLGEQDYWRSMAPIPRWDPETKNIRAKPNDGIGSGVDWWFIRNHPESVCKSGRTNLVMPGLVQHAGYKQSTWLQNGREMPESDSDKEKVK